MYMYIIYLPITVDVVDTTVSHYCVHALIHYIYCRVLVMHLLVLWHIIYRGIPSLSFTEKIRRSSVIASHTVTLRGTQTSFVTDLLPNDLLN